MTQSNFLRLLAASSDEHSLDLAYDEVLRELFARPLWQAGSVLDYRVLWTDGRRARDEDPVPFQAIGLYLWGCEERPLYIGKTNNGFRKRFSRYVWDTRSQCNLARDFETPLRLHGVKGFPDEIRDWYATYTTSTVRLEGAARFAQEGLERVWFTLLPHGNSDDISLLEKLLVRSGQRWNDRAGIRELLNVDFATGTRRRKR
jgi:hypothetical protein